MVFFKWYKVYFFVFDDGVVCSGEKFDIMLIILFLSLKVLWEIIILLIYFCWFECLNFFIWICSSFLFNVILEI